MENIHRSAKRAKFQPPVVNPNLAVFMQVFFVLAPSLLAVLNQPESDHE